jgi:hypothetical protein
VLVRPNLRSRIVDLHDVQVTTPSDGQVLRYDSGVFENDTLTAGDVGAIPTTEKGAANGVASLGADGVVPDAQVSSALWPSHSSGINRYYGLRFRQGNTSFNMIAGNAYSSVVEVPVDMSITALVLSCGNPTAGSLIEIAIYTYNQDSSGACNLIASVGTVDASTSGVKEAVFVTPVNVSKGSIRLVAIWNGIGSAPSMTSALGSYTNGSPNINGILFNQNNNVIGSASYPLPATISSFDTSLANYPLIFYRGTPQ